MKLGEALRVAAQDAGMYADPKRALEMAFRRRRRRLVANSAATAALLITAVWAAQFLPFKARDLPASPRPAATSAGGTASKGAYPTRVEPPSGAATALPTDRGVDPAAFIYSVGNRPLLVTTTGAQYALPTPNLFNSGLVALSPDGRWLLDGSVLRDLTSTTIHDVPRGTAQWSADARWLLIETSSDHQLVDTATGRAIPVANAAGVLDTGQVLVASNIQRTRATITITDADSGGNPHKFIVDGSSVLTGDEGIAGRSGDSGFSLYQVWPYSTDRALFEVQGTTNLVLLDVSLTDGRILHRIVVPAEQPPYQFWAIAGLDSGKLVLRHQPPANTTPSPGTATPVTPYQLAVIDPSGGTPAVVCTIPAHSLVIVRGTNRAL